MNPIACYETVSVSAGSTILGNGQTTDNRLWVPPRHLQNLTVAPSEGIAIGGFSCQNRSGSTVVFGIGGRIANNLWRAGQYVNATTTYTDDTDDAQDAGATDFPLETTTINDGFVVLSKVPFNAVSIDLGTTSAGAAVARTARYSDAAGTGWTNITTADMFTFTSATSHYTAGTESVMIFPMPVPDVQWGRSTNTLATGVPAGMYALNVRTTDAAETTAGVADTIGVYRLVYVIESLADNIIVEWDMGGKELFIPGADGLVASFGTPSVANHVTAFVRMRG